MKSFPTTLKTTVALALVSLSAGAFANNVASAPLEQAVSFAQLDMTQPAAAEQLYDKLTAVAKQVCEPVNGGLLRQKMEFRACVKETLANAVDEVNRPQLSSVHAARTGSAVTAVRVAVK